MCGRYITPEEGDLERHWELTPAEGFRQNFNTAPSQLAPVIRLNADGELHLGQLQWGFQPPWSKRAWINARSETAFESRAFKSAALKRRCLVPAIGWYEWQGAKAPKQPWCFHLEGFRPFVFAGIWTAREIDDGWMQNFAILTRAAEPYLDSIHNRMPVLLSPQQYDDWLAGDAVTAAATIGQPFERISTYKVSSLVNKPQNNGPECIAPVSG